MVRTTLLIGQALILGLIGFMRWNNFNRYTLEEFRRCGMINFILYLLVCSIIPCTLSSADDLYQWNDRDGITHYSNIPDTTSSESEEHQIILIPETKETTESDSSESITVNADSKKVQYLTRRIQSQIEITHNEIINIEARMKKIERQIYQDRSNYASCFVIIEDRSQTTLFRVIRDYYRYYGSATTFENVPLTAKAYCKLLLSTFDRLNNEYEALTLTVQQLESHLEKLNEADYSLTSQELDEATLMEIEQLLAQP